MLIGIRNGKSINIGSPWKSMIRVTIGAIIGSFLVIHVMVGFNTYIAIAKNAPTDRDITIRPQ